MNNLNLQQFIQKFQLYFQNHKQKAWVGYEKILNEHLKSILGDANSPEINSALLMLSQAAYDYGYESGVIGTTDAMQSLIPLPVIPSNN